MSSASSSLPPALACPQSNEAILLDVASLLPSFPCLRRLHLHATFIQTSTINATAAICENLVSLPRLEEFGLSGNALGDSGAKEVAQLLRHPQCPPLTLLDLRRNYIGEGGLNDICMAMSEQDMRRQRPLRLRALYLGSNIAGHAVRTLAIVLASGKLQHLVTLSLEDNFVDINGMTELAHVLRQGRCPSLRKLCIGDNLVETKTIEHLFAFVLTSDIRNSGSTDRQCYVQQDAEEPTS
jgi:Ran GTPase-activating protein (RanGAP) involved in mRNA processing and transport